MNPIFSADIIKGKVVFTDRDSFDSYLLSLEGKPVDVIVRKHRKNRTNPQNRYLWGVVYDLISEYTGHTSDEIHDSMRAMFLIDSLGHFPVVRSTTGLTTIEMTEYIEKIRQFASQELNLVIPDPQDVDFTSDEIINEREQREKDAKEYNDKPVDREFLEEIFKWADNGGITVERIVQLSIENFNKEPKDLTQLEAEKLDTIIVSEII